MKNLFCFIFFTMLVLVGCGLETKTLPEFYENDLDGVTKLAIVDGSTGDKKTVTDQKVINKFLNELENIKFIPDEDQEKRAGWRYSITLFQQDESTFRFTLSEIDEHYYHTEPDIFPIVDDFYEKLDIHEE